MIYTIIKNNVTTCHLSPLSVLQFHLADNELKREHSVKCQVGQVTQSRQGLRSAPHSLTESPKQSTIVGYRDTAKGYGWQEKKR
jgi:hypothetical protein